MSGRRADGTNPKATVTNPNATGTNPRAQGINPRAIRAQLDRIESKQDEILRLLSAVHGQHRTGTHGPVTLDDGRVFLPGTGTVGPSELSDEARAALAALDAADPTT